LGDPGGVAWVASYDEGAPTSNDLGSDEVELINFDPTLGGGFPNAVRYTAFHGVTQRTGPRSWRYTMIMYVLDSLDNIVYIAKNSGIKKLSHDCSTMYLDYGLELYGPGQDPFDDEPPLYGCSPGDPLTATRMTVEAPACGPVE
jgi:hypothetical protein